MKKIRTKLLLVLLVIAALGIYYYAALPAINIHSTEFWVFLLVLGILAALIFIKKKNLSRYELKESKGLKVIIGVVALIVIVYLVGALLSSPIVNAKKFKLDIKLNPEWRDVNHIISGGPYLVKNGDIYVDMTAQKLASIGGRNPRTAIGYTADNHLIMLTADGREGASIGLTLMELARLMKELGCVNAMNLDGGGSTVMFIKGKVVNKPAIQGGIPLSHTLNIKVS